VATPLAVILTELLQNAAEHAFPEDSVIRGAGLLRIHVRLTRDDRQLVVEVRDNGAGLPEGFSVDQTTSLGLSIVRDLVRTQLAGTIAMHTDGGTVVVLTVPIDSEGGVDYARAATKPLSTLDGFRAEA
jgi:two-component sensor histidine kinase